MAEVRESVEMTDASQVGTIVDAARNDDGREEEDEEEEEELTPLEFARLQGITQNHLTDTSASDHIDELKGQVGDIVLTDDTHLPPLAFGPIPEPKDPFYASREALEYLQAFQQDMNPDAIEAIMDPMLTPMKIRSLHVELPLLRSDHETDCVEFSRREGFEVKLQDINFPLEIVDEENGEGLSIPSKYLEIGHQIVEDIKKEKLVCSKETIAYLSDVLNASWDEEDEDKLWAEEQTYQRKTMTHPFEPVTPPLLPLSPPPTRYEPSSSSPTFILPLEAETNSMITQDLKALEKDIMKKDLPSPFRNLWEGPRPSEAELEKLEEVFLPLLGSTTTTPPMPPRFKSEDHKVEEILTPQNQPAGVKGVRFSDHIEVMNDHLESMLLDEHIPSDKTEEIKEVLQRNFGEAHKTATRKSEQENLIGADSTARVDIRIMPSVTPVAPWAALQQCSNATQLLDLQKQMLSLTVGRLPTWKVKNDTVLWVPFPHKVAQVQMQQDPPPCNDKLWQDIVGSDTEEVMDSSGLTWKPPGLRILRVDEDEDDDDEIEPAIFKKDKPKDIAALVKKRKKELEEDEIGRYIGSRGRLLSLNQGLNSAQAIPRPPSRPKAPAPGSELVSAARKSKFDSVLENETDMLLGGTFSAGNLIENFKELRGVKKAKLHEGSYFEDTLNNKVPNSKQAGAEEPDQVQLPFRTTPIPIPTVTPLPAPSLSPQSTPISIIVSSTLLKHRILIRHLESLLPSLTLVERDFSAHNTTTWIPGSVTRSPITSPLDSEADLVISPSTGILITSFQKVKQQLLPGQKGKTAIQSRLCKVSVRYEKLLVLVTEEQKDETTNGLDKNDCIAFTEFIGFASGLPTAITVQFVAGGEESLAKWVASLIVQHRIPNGADLLPDETYWELFLRRAGLNAYAAQQIVFSLKPPIGVDGLNPTKAGHFGLAAFVEMGRENRLARFGPLCGRQVVERVSDVVDGIWQ
ncbi:hypothetical protein HYALB_00002660 [Hymenoscyphus albidus]|uniref:Uncharacterized protein n=1 Tax=Hymenoscyphus albidus TaxID=595503 RepID=A0A9N9LWI6_9HELO|nr:hypothetical protein HYALB_00002660 [Hymenoscyphus albidus]